MKLGNLSKQENERALYGLRDELSEAYADYAKAAMEEIEKLYTQGAPDQRNQLDAIFSEHEKIWRKHEAVILFSNEKSSSKNFQDFWFACQNGKHLYLPSNHPDNAPIPENIKLDGARGKFIRKTEQEKSRKKLSKPKICAS